MKARAPEDIRAGRRAGRRIGRGPVTAVLAFALGAAALPAAAGMDLPEASKDHWTEHAIVDGSLAQINARGEGRFAVFCMKGDQKGAIFYRAPAAAREELRAAGDSLRVVFEFDGGERIERTLAWDEAGTYWTDPFGPKSSLAEAMKRRYDLRIAVEDHPGVESEFTLKDSYRSIAAMFARC